MCRISRSSGISRCFWLVFSLLLLASGTCSAQTVYYWSGQYLGGGATITGGDAVALATEIGNAWAQANNVSCMNGGSEWCFEGGVEDVQCSVTGAPTSVPEQSICTFKDADDVSTPACAAAEAVGNSCGSPPGPSPGGVTLNAVVQSQQACVASTTPTYFSGNSGTAPGSECSGGCLYTPGDVGIQVPGMGWGQAYQESGATCSQAPTGTDGSNCVSGPSGTFCAQTQGSGANQCVTVNGNQVCASAVPPNGCVSYQDGSEACSTTASPPAPNSGTPGSPATPTATVSQAAPPGGSPSTSYYFSSTVVAGSAGGTTSTSGGQNIGNGGAGPGQCGSTANPCAVTGGGGSSNGQGTCGADASAPCDVVDANAAANGDCSSGDCSTGANGMPTYDWSSDSWGGALQSFWNSVSAGPIATALNGISENWPGGGSCPSEQVSLSTINYTADYGTEFCSLWASDALPVLEGVMLALWSLIAVYIFLSA